MGFMVTSQIYPVMGRIHTGITDQLKPLPPTTELKLEFERQSDDFCLLTKVAGGLNCKLTLIAFHIEARFLKADPEIVNDILEITNAGDPIKYQIRRVEMMAFSRVPGIQDYSIIDVFSKGGILPRRIFIGLVREDAQQGDASRNPFTYKPYNIQTVALRVGGHVKPYPQIKNPLQALNYLKHAIEPNLPPHADCGINIDNYTTLNYIMGWDLSPVNTPPMESFTLPSKEQVNLDIHLSAPNAFPVVIILYAEFEAEMLMDAQGKIIKNKEHAL